MISIDVAYINNNSVGLLGRFNKNRAKFPKIHGIATLPTRKKIRYFGSRRILALTAVKKYDVAKKPSTNIAITDKINKIISVLSKIAVKNNHSTEYIRPVRVMTPAI